MGDRNHFYREMSMGLLTCKRVERKHRESALLWVAAARQAHGYTLHVDRDWRDSKYI